MKVAIVFVGGSPKQNECFWPSYERSVPGIEHDIILVHRNMNGVVERTNPHGKLILENKIDSHGKELPNRAFGAYREYWRRYQDKYDFFAFISDDVIIKSDNWLLDAVTMLDRYERLGFVGTQIFNGGTKYPHPSHCRAPIWFAKSNSLKEITWEFESDHDGEMKIAQQFVKGGYFGAQLGCKIDVAYDSLERGGHFVGDHVTSILETSFHSDIKSKMLPETRRSINFKLIDLLLSGDDSMSLKSPFKHIGTRRVVSQIQPFNGLLFDGGIGLAAKVTEKYPLGVCALKGELERYR